MSERTATVELTAAQLSCLWRVCETYKPDDADLAVYDVALGVIQQRLAEALRELDA